jgi:hypothetical protein
MPCVVCSRTLANLGIEGRRVFHCGTCGTVVIEGAGEKAPDHTTIPTLVRRVQAAADTVTPLPFGWSHLNHQPIFGVDWGLWHDIADYAGRKVQT